MGSTSFFAT